jgi:exodeoxyribonuclease VII small subunit
MARKETKGGFEANLQRLEQIVAELEKGEIDLERSLKLYEEGAGLIAACRKQLTEAETRIEKLRPTAEGLAAEPFEGEEEAEQE